MTLWSQTLIPTSRQIPGDAEVPSHQLMVRAGYIRKLGAGVYDYLPLGYRSLRKVEAIIREEMERAGAVEVHLPVLQPIELFDQTGRREAYGDNLFVLRDRHGRQQALGPTHEEVITELVGSCVESYKQLPLTLYQIQTKFRDEFRPRFGVLRTREFQMKDAYSFHISLESLEETYRKQYDAYCRIFDRCGLPYEIVEAESGPIGGSASHEFMVPSLTGEDSILKSDKGNYAANVEKSGIGIREHSFAGEPTGELEKVHTPGCATIEDVSRFMKVKPVHMLKTLVFVAAQDTAALKAHGSDDADSQIVVAVVRSDHDVNESKLRAAVFAKFQQFSVLELADQDRAARLGYVIGFVGPHQTVRRTADLLVVDPDAAGEQFWASGANERDHHVKHFNWNRDVLGPLGDAVADRVLVTDIRNAIDGDPSPLNDGGILRETRGIEVGHVFKLGAKYSDSMGVSVLDENNERCSIIMGCYGIGINRILAAAIERPAGYDDDGIVWPASIAPYEIIITPIKYEGVQKQTALRLADQVEALGHDVLIDDRTGRPGVKFKDADLIGVPLRITIGEKGLQEGQVEIKTRSAPTGSKPEWVPIDAVAVRADELLATL